MHKSFDMSHYKKDWTQSGMQITKYLKSSQH
jgi:hypothetical protein